jgi:hypothetical protein
VQDSATPWSLSNRIEQVQHASATTVNMPQAECNAAGGPTLPLESTTDKGIRSRMVLGRCELASLVRGFSLFPQRTRLTCVNWGPRLSVIGRMASALWAWTAQMGAPPWSIDRSSRTRSAGSLRGVAQTDHAHNHRVLSAACMKRLVHGNFPNTPQTAIEVQS